MKISESANAVERLDCENSRDALQVVLHNQRYEFVLERIVPQDAVLEIGTGSGCFSSALAGRCLAYTGLEFDPVACEMTRDRLKGRGTLVQGDAQALPFGDQSFSAIVCLEVLEHLPDYRNAVREIHRCLKPEGHAIISVPYRKVGGKNPQNQFHLYEPGEAELVDAFKQFFGKVEVWHQYFEETPLMAFARNCHIRRFLGLSAMYHDLTLGKPAATARIKIESLSKGMNITLLLTVSGRKEACAQKS